MKISYGVVLIFLHPRSLTHLVGTKEKSTKIFLPETVRYAHQRRDFAAR